MSDHVIAYHWTDERDEDNVYDRTFVISFTCTDRGYKGDATDPGWGPEFDITGIYEDLGDGKRGDLDTEERNILETSGHVYDCMLKELFSNIIKSPAMRRSWL